MRQNKIYAGIGSRETPPEILERMTDIARRLATNGYTLRSGGARGADSAFEKAAEKKEIFYAQDATPWAMRYVEEFCMPVDRNDFRRFKPYTRALLARNMHQILGRDGKSLVDFVICWAPSLDYSDSSSGGTGYALRCAEKNGIPIYNLFDPECELPKPARRK